MILQSISDHNNMSIALVKFVENHKHEQVLIEKTLKSHCGGGEFACGPSLLWT